MTKLPGRALVWSAIEVTFRQLVMFTVSVVLARLLAPELFGIVAILQVFIALASVLVDSGFSSALIQKKELDSKDASTVFWITVLVALVVATLFVLAAPHIAAFYREPKLEPLAFVMAGCLLLSSTGAVHTALLTKGMEFRRLATASIFSTLGSGVAAVVAASNGCGIWALAVQAVVASTLSTIAIWRLSGWRPSLVFCANSARTLFRFGGFVCLSTVLEVVYARAYALLVGRMYGVHEVGIFARANDLSLQPSGFFGGIVSRVLFPLFASRDRCKEEVRRLMQRAIAGVMVTYVPVILGLFAVSERFVLVLFGDAWSEAVPLMRILCLAALFWPLSAVNLQAILGLGHSHIFFRFEVFKKILGFTLLFSGAAFGLEGIAWGQLVSSVAALFINTMYSKSILNYGLIEQLKDSVRVLVSGMLMATCVLVADQLILDGIEVSGSLGLLALMSLGIVVYGGLAVLLDLGGARDIYRLVFGGKRK